MHISEGILAWPVLAAGAAVAAAATGVGLRRMSEERVPRVAILSAAFFVASLIHVPVGPASVHLILNGLIGLLLGWMAFPAVLVGLVLQAVLFQFGGLTTLGANTVIMAAPAVGCHYLFRSGVASRRRGVAWACAFLCGAGAVFLGSLLVALSLVFTGEAFIGVARLVVAAHLPVMVVEGFITALCISFLRRVKPEMLRMAHTHRAERASNH